MSEGILVGDLEDIIACSQYYGTRNYVLMQQAMTRVLDRLDDFPADDGNGLTAIDHVMHRIKSPRSMQEKMRRRGIDGDGAVAIRELTDAVGIRVVCSFVDDVYKVKDWLEEMPEACVTCIKDYIAQPKPSGYRSLHMLLDVQVPADAARHAPAQRGELSEGEAVHVEVQIRTIAQDCWAALEHQIGYKHGLDNEGLIRKELQRCSDEIASTDLSMQTIRDLIAQG